MRIRSLSMPEDERFVLSPILSHFENQEKLQAIIDDDTGKDNDFSFEEINVVIEKMVNPNDLLNFDEKP